jgi:hypothetical protein
MPEADPLVGSGGDAGAGSVQDFADGATEGGGAVRLLEIARRRKLHPGRARGFGIATGEENGQIGKAGQESRSGGGTTHTRHDDIKDGKRGGLGFTQPEGLLAVGGSQNTVVEADERLTNHFADGIVVFGDQDSLGTVKIEGRRGLRGGTASGESDFHDRKIDAEEAALLRFTVDVDESAMLLDDAINSSKTHAATAAALLGREERLKDAIASLRVHADAGVGNGKDGVRTGDDVRIEAAVGIVEDRHFGFNGEAAAIGHGIAGVEAEVHENLLDLGGVGFDGLKIGGDEFHFDVLVDDLVEETGEAVEGGIEIDGAGLKGLTASEGKEFASERSGAIGLLANTGKALGDDRMRAALFIAEFGPAKDCPDDVIEVVSDAAGELTDALEFLRLEQLAFEKADFGDVLGDTFDGIGGSREREVAEVETDGNQAAIATAPFGFVTVNEAMLAAGSEQARKVFGIAKDVGGEIEGLEFVKGVASQKLEKGRIGAEERAFERDAKDAVNGVFDEFAATGFAFFELKTELGVHVAKLFVFESALQSDREARETILKDVIGQAMLGAFDGCVLRECAGDEKKGSVVTGLAKVRESVKTGPARQRVSSEYNRKVLRRNCGFKFGALIDDGGLDGNAGVAEFAENGSGVVRGMLEQQNAERRSGRRRFELFG